VDVLSEKERDETEEFENMAEGKEKYLLRLYVTGMTPRSVLAIENIRRICEERLKGRYERARARAYAASMCGPAQKHGCTLKRGFC
jgi:hypothetical protein